MESLDTLQPATGGRLRARSPQRLAIALAMTLATVSGLSAHRRDEYLQAARIGIEPGRVQVELDLTPGIALAEGIIADIDRNRDGVLSKDEQRAYADQVVSTLTLAVDTTPVPAQLNAVSFPDPAAMRRGEGAIRLQTTAPLPRLAAGSHALLFRNRHHPGNSVYLANALVPASDDVAITAQRRDGDQTELTVEYQLHAPSPWATRKWLLGGIAILTVLSFMWIQRARSTRAAAR